MRHLLLLASVLTACTGTSEPEPVECNTELESLGSDLRNEFYKFCSSETPDGIWLSSTPVTGTLIGPREGYAGERAAIALGGTMEVAVERFDGTPFDLPYRVETAGHVGVAEQAGAALTLTGEAEAFEWLALVEPDAEILFGATSIHVAPVETIALVSGTNEKSDPETPVAFAPGTRRVGIALRSGSFDSRLVDLGMTIDAPGSQRVAWDIVELAPGSSSMTVTAAGGAPETLTMTTATADRIAELASNDREVYWTNMPVRVCFGAFAEATQVLGHAWTLTVDGEVHTPDGPQNCTSFVRESVGDVTISASAGGFTTSVEIYVDTDLRGRSR